MRSRALIGCVSLWGLMLLAGAAVAQTFTVFDVPNSVGNSPEGINAGGAITGWFHDTMTNTRRGFVRDPNGAITVFDAAPNAETTPFGINAVGQITGVTSGLGGGGFVRDPNGVITVFRVPNANFTQPVGINAAGEIAGYCCEDPVTEGAERGFVRDPNGVITVFDALNADDTETEAISDAGEITGIFHDTMTNKYRGFVRHQNGGFTVFDAPNALYTAPQSINAAGKITGWFYDTTMTTFRGFVRDQYGVITVFDAPNANQTGPRSINEAGEITGAFSEAETNLTRGFVLDRHGVITAFDPPNSSSTQPCCINVFGQITGTFDDTNTNAGTTTRRGFVLNLYEESATAEPGGSASVSTAPATDGEAGVSATLTNNNGGGGTATLTVQSFFDTNPATPNVLDVGGQYVDLRVDGADLFDTVIASFYYPATVTGVAEAELQLLYFTGSSWAAVRSSPGTDPAKDTTDNLGGTVSGGRFTVTFDGTSTPLVTELTGTVFTPAVVSPVAGVRVLAEKVAALDLNRGQRWSLSSKLSAAEKSLARGNAKTAANQLNAFINEVQALKRTERLPAGVADKMVGLAQATMSALGTT